MNLIVWGGGIFLGSFFLFALVANIIFWCVSLWHPAPEIPRGKITFLYCLNVYLNTIFGYFVTVLLRFLGPLFFVRQFFLKGQEQLENKQREQIAKYQAMDQGASQAKKLGEQPTKFLTGHPVLCVHGVYESDKIWLPTRKALIQQGFLTTTFVYSSFFMSILSIVDIFEIAIATLEKKHPQQKPFIVAHSLGGIIVRLWMQRNNNGARLSGVIALATPHKGSILARFACGRLIKNLVPNSSLLREMAKHSQPLACPCVSLFTATDGSVLPATSLLPPLGWRKRLIAPCSHCGMLIRKHSIRAVIEELQLMQKQ